MKRLIIAAVLLATPVVASANTFWNVVGGVVVGGIVLDGIRGSRDREEIYYVEPPPPRRVVHCINEFTFDRYGRKVWYKTCYDEYVPAY